MLLSALLKTVGDVGCRRVFEKSNLYEGVARLDDSIDSVASRVGGGSSERSHITFFEQM